MFVSFVTFDRFLILLGFNVKKLQTREWLNVRRLACWDFKVHVGVLAGLQALAPEPVQDTSVC